MSPNLSVSVIVSTYNWPQALERVLIGLEEQTFKSPFEILIADDGSTQETQIFVAEFQSRSRHILKHIWQEDKGFQPAAIRNKAIAAATGEYILFLDGDSVPRKNFVEQHLKLAEPGFWVAGSRILLTREFTETVFAQKIPLHRLSVWQMYGYYLSKKINRFMTFLSLPLGKLRYLSLRKWKGAKGCNFAVFRKDLLAIKGFDESFTGWGYEDADLYIRLFSQGILRKSGKFATVVLHLWHPTQDRRFEKRNYEQLLARQKSGQIFPVKGMDIDFA